MINACQDEYILQQNLEDGIILTKESPKEFLSHIQNTEHIKLNNELINYALSLKETFSDQFLLEKVTSYVGNAEFHESTISELQLKYTEILTEENKLSSDKKTRVPSPDINPNIFVPNANIAEFNGIYIIAIGSDFPSDIEQYEDMIPGWYCDGKISEHCLIGEDFAYNTTIPVYILNSKSVQDTTEIETIIEVSPQYPLRKSITTEKPYITDYKIDRRYDNSNRSEYSYIVGYHYANGGLQGGSQYRTEIREIHKDDLDVLFTDEFYVFETQSFDLQGIFISTFEYDWYASKKAIYIAGPGFNYTVYGRMSEDYNYYQKTYFDMDSGNVLTVSTKGQMKIVN